MASVSHRSSARRRPLLYARDYGVTGNGVTDDRATIQRVLTLASNMNGGADVYFHDGTYRITRNTTTDYCLLVAGDKVRIIGESEEDTIFSQATGIATSVRLLRYEGDDCAAMNFTLEGNKASQSVNEHRHGIIAVGAARLLVEQVTAQNFTGDGFYLHLNTNDAIVRSCTGSSNDRNGVTVGAQLYDLLIKGNTFSSNQFQQIDCEPGSGNIPERISVIGNVANCGSGNDYCIALGGPSNTELTRGWTIRGNIVTGSIYSVWAQDIVIEGNTIVNPTTKSCVEVYRKNVNTKVHGNSITLTGSQTSTAGVYIQGAGTGDAPTTIDVRDNTIVVGSANPAQFGIRAEASISVVLEDNDLTGGAVANSLNSGIYIRPTNAAEDWETVEINRNAVRNFGNYGIGLFGNGAAAINSFIANGNTFEDTSATPTMTVGMDLDDGSVVTDYLEVRDNVFGDEIATEIAWNADNPVLHGYTDSNDEIWVTTVAPEGVVAATVGAIALLTSGGVFTATYEKTSGHGNTTGWTLVS
jgi:hypothetical protein